MPAQLSLSDIPTISRIYRSGTRTRPCQPPIHPASTRLNEIVSHITYDITCLEVDCIVNAANEFLRGGNGVDGAIHSAAGPSLLEECSDLNGCATGDAKITEAYRLPCKKVIHAVGPRYYMRCSISEKEDLLRSCYRRSLELAAENGMRSIAFSSLSTGIYGYPSYDAANTAIDEVRKYLTKDINQEKLDRVIFCTFLQKDRDAYEEFLPQYFPPTEHDFNTTNEHDSCESSDEMGYLVQVELGKQAAGRDDEWEEVSEEGNRSTNELEEDPVEVEKDASVADVQSMQSSSVDFHVLSASEGDIKGNEGRDNTSDLQ